MKLVWVAVKSTTQRIWQCVCFVVAVIVGITLCWNCVCVVVITAMPLNSLSIFVTVSTADSKWKVSVPVRAAITLPVCLCLSVCLCGRERARQSDYGVQSRPVSDSDHSDPYANTLTIYFCCRGSYVIGHVLPTPLSQSPPSHFTFSRCFSHPCDAPSEEQHCGESVQRSAIPCRLWVVSKRKHRPWVLHFLTLVEMYLNSGVLDKMDSLCSGPHSSANTTKTSASPGLDMSQQCRWKAAW